MPTRPMPLAGAPTTELTAVPWKSSMETTVWGLSAVVFGRDWNSGWERSRPVSMTVTGTPGEGGENDPDGHGTTFQAKEGKHNCLYRSRRESRRAGDDDRAGSPTPRRGRTHYGAALDRPD